MATKRTKQQTTDGSADLLRDLLIIELAKAGVPQPEIRTIVGCDMHRVNKIARHFKRTKREGA
jgi:hypothetical protein